mmetsp:Transcript_91073/g.253567  ORF Transcript_91073/g.253567 Transcript_91073/m.253567 type:complete len:124 (+) Transcript_91073:95-466(+)
MAGRRPLLLPVCLVLLLLWAAPPPRSCGLGAAFAGGSRVAPRTPVAARGSRHDPAAAAQRRAALPPATAVTAAATAGPLDGASLAAVLVDAPDKLWWLPYLLPLAVVAFVPLVVFVYFQMQDQ